MEDPLPLFPLNTVLVPGMFLPLHIFEERYRLMIQECLDHERDFGVVLIRSGQEAGGPAIPHAVGTTARIVRLDPQEDGRFHLIALGEHRFRIRELLPPAPYLLGHVEPVEDSDVGDASLDAAARQVGREFKQYIALLLSFADKWISDFETPTDPLAASFYVAARINLPAARKQRLIELTSTRARLLEELELLRRESAELETMAGSRSARDGEGRPA